MIWNSVLQNMNADKNRMMDSSGNVSARLRRRAVPAIVLACCMVFAAGCAGAGGSTMPPGSAGDTAAGAGAGKISVVTTIFPPYDFVREIAGDEADIKMLLKGRVLMPDMAVIDARFTMTAPPKITAATGLGAACHGIEA